MTALTVRIEAAVDGTNEEIEEQLDAVMEALGEIDGADPAIEVDYGTGIVHFSVTVHAVNPLLAMSEAAQLLQKVIYLAGANTGSWPEANEFDQAAHRFDRLQHASNWKADLVHHN